eukprot:7512480-Pyramimonas_sp.AAC.2
MCVDPDRQAEAAEAVSEAARRSCSSAEKHRDATVSLDSEVAAREAELQAQVPPPRLRPL